MAAGSAVVRIRQLLCVHWFDVGPDVQREVSVGGIVNLQRKQYRIMEQQRICSKCDLREVRRVGEYEFLGWD